MNFAKLIAKIDHISDAQPLREGWEDMMKAVDTKAKEKGTDKFDKKEISTGTQYTRKANTFTDGGTDSDVKAAKKKVKEDDIEEGFGDVASKVGGALKKAGSKVLDTLGHEDDVLKDLQKKAGIPAHAQHGKPNMARANDDKEIKEDDMEEGNEFSGELAKAKAAGKTDFEVDGKKYQVKEATSADLMKSWVGIFEAEDTEADKKKCPPMSHIKKMCQDGKSVAEICKMHPDCDHTELKQLVADCKKKLQEGAKPDFLDMDKDGDKKEPMKDAVDDEDDEEKVDESAVPGQEAWIKSNKSKFVEHYGREKGLEVLYATAIKRNKSIAESLALEGCYDQSMEQMQQPESGMNISSNIDTKTGNKSLTITAQGAAAEELAQIIKLSGMIAQAPGAEPEEAEIEIGEEYSNEPHPMTQSTEVQMQQGNDMHRVKQSYPKVAGGDNPMAMAEARKLAEIENQLMEELAGIKITSESKPSAGMSKKEKSAVVKKAKAGKDIGKPGKSFDKVAKSAGGGEKGEKIAAAAMWKNAAKK
jgi:hypothetical protein